MDRIRWGILSTARINDCVIGPMKRSARSGLAAVASRDLDKATAYAQVKGIPKAYGRYEDLLSDPEIDAVYISLPNGLHREWTVKAAEAGKHVLCEKPIVPTLEDLDLVEAAAAANGVTVFEAFMYLHLPQTRKVKQMIWEGELGNLQVINGWLSFLISPENTWDFRMDPSMSAGSMWDVGVYPNSLAIVMAHAGLPEEVWARQILGPTGVDICFDAQMRFLTGAVAQFSAGFRTTNRDGAHIVGDKGTIRLDNPWGWPAAHPDYNFEIAFSRVDGREEVIHLPAVDPYLCEVQAMEACVLDGADPVVPLSLSRDFLKSTLALYQSARTGKVVRVA